MCFKEKYNNLVEAIKELRDINPSDEGIRKWVNDNVPELAESEDERIRKEIINSIKELRLIGTTRDREKAIAWLEKQGEQSKTDKVKHPKFNVGDWIVSPVLGTAHIIGVNNSNEYQLKYIDGKQEFSSIDYVNYAYDKWTIEDAKAGDVLVSELIDSIILFKGIEDNNIQFYCDYDFYDIDTEIDVRRDRFGVNNNGQHYGSVDDSEDFHPVTKEQRDLLFQKMKEYGYEWNAENKQLKKQTKFHEGDWIVNDYCVGKIIALTDDAYLLDTEQYIPFSYEHNAHLWSINDAKDGDVLVSRVKQPFIFKNYDEETAFVYAYCGITDLVENYGFYVDNEDVEVWTCYHNNGDVQPATKEQRDLLFTKMRASEYEWDTEKKELKKIAEPQEENSTDNVEPKFKVGDWVVDNCGCVWKIKSSTNIFFTLENVEGVESQPTIEWLDRIFHLWTIEDAKNGDVLVASSVKGQEGEEQVFIFKGINSRDYIDNCIEYYCRVCCDTLFYVNTTGYMGTTSSPLCPATKEQRDLLFSKMREAGYEWDTEKKELIKITETNEENSTDKVGPKFKVGDWIVTDKYGTIQIGAVNTGYYTLKNGMDFSTSYAEKYWRLWTIQDAKDGDILYDGDNACIFRKTIKFNDDIWIDSYCGINIDNEFNVNEEDERWCLPECCSPSTKEQCNLLFSKMEEEGYEWNAKKKELKKIEPKFKVGDWVTNGHRTRQITFIDSRYWYSEIDVLGNTKDIDKTFHLWTINDANDGDVLVASDGSVFIYAGSTSVYAQCYIALGRLGHLYTALDTDNWEEKNCVHPATKEQQDLLFQKMKEEGYEWDAENKVTKPIIN